MPAVEVMPAVEFLPAVELMAATQRVCVLSGAGISTDSGIPDFRGPAGLWTVDPGAARMFDITAYLNDPQLRQRAWAHRIEHPAWGARPNAGHIAVASLFRQGRLSAVATQNIDGLHQAAGLPAERVLELHGTLHRVVCLSCGALFGTWSVLARVRAGELDPACIECGGLLKTATVAFGQRLDSDVLRAARRAVLQAQVLLAVGSSLSVIPAAGLCDLALRAGTAVIIVNAEPTRYDDRATHVVRGSISQVLPVLCAS